MRLVSHFVGGGLIFCYFRLWLNCFSRKWQVIWTIRFLVRVLVRKIWSAHLITQNKHLILRYELILVFLQGVTWLKKKKSCHNLVFQCELNLRTLTTIIFRISHLLNLLILPVKRVISLLWRQVDGSLAKTLVPTPTQDKVFFLFIFKTGKA